MMVDPSLASLDSIVIWTAVQRNRVRFRYGVLSNGSILSVSFSLDHMPAGRPVRTAMSICLSWCSRTVRNEGERSRSMDC